MMRRSTAPGRVSKRPRPGRDPRGAHPGAGARFRPRLRGLLPSLGLLLVSCGRGPAPGDLAGWNLLLVTIDTLRADRVGFAGYGGAETPILDRLAEKGIVFENVVAAAPVTLPSHATILTGLYPPAHGALDNGTYSLPEDVPTLATVLRERGYETAAFVGAIVLGRRYGVARGFDVFDDRIHEPRALGQAFRERRAEEVNARVAAWIRERAPGRPFFAWIHYYDPHAPYDPPPEFRRRFPDRLYDGEIAYSDRAIGTLLETIRRAGELERTLVIVTSDHGEALGDGGELTHGLLLRGSTLRVPMVMAAPGKLPAGRRVRGVVSGADVVPTALDLLGIEAPGRTDGESLLEAISAGRTESRYAYSETRLPADQYGWAMLAGVRGERWAWVRAPRPELYDLGEDPEESVSLHDQEPEVAADLDARVGRILSGGRDSKRSALSEDEIEALRSLGYVFSEEVPEPTGADPKDMVGIQRETILLANLLEQGENERAIAAAHRILGRDRTNRDALLFLAQALDRTGKVDEAIDAAQRALRAGGTLDLDGTLLAMYLMKAGRLEESEKLLRAFSEAEPEYAEHPFNLGNLLAQSGNLEGALDAYERAYELNPDAPHITANLAVTLSKATGERADPDRALRLIDRAIALAVEDDLPRLIKIEICQRLGRRELGMEVARELQQKRELKNVTKEALAEAIRSLRGS